MSAQVNAAAKSAIDEFAADVAQHAMQAVWRAVYPDDAEPTNASVRFIDHVISVARDGSLPLGRRLERLENMLGQYLRTHRRAGPDTSAIVLQFVPARLQ